MADKEEKKAQVATVGAVHAAWAAVLADADAIGKDSKNLQQGFKYRGIDAVMNAIHPLMAKHRVYLLTEVLSHTQADRQTKAGGALIVRVLSIRFHVVSGEDGSETCGIVLAEGADSGDKAANKAMAVGLKYFLCQSLCLPYEEVDPDAESHELASSAGKKAPVAPVAPTTSAARAATPPTVTPHPPAVNVPDSCNSDDTIAEVVVGKVGYKSGITAKGKTWERWFFKGDDGQFYGTFDTKLGNAMRNLEGARAVVSYRQEERGRVLLSIRDAEVAPDSAYGIPATNETDSASSAEAQDNLPF